RAAPACTASYRRCSRSASLPAVVCRSGGVASVGSGSEAMPDRLGQMCRSRGTGLGESAARRPRARKGGDMTGGLEPDSVRDSVLAGSKLWSPVLVVTETGSTNADLIAAARDGAGEGTVLVAERQTAGRGRLGRSWLTEPGAALTFSVLLRPTMV